MLPLKNDLKHFLDPATPKIDFNIWSNLLCPMGTEVNHGFPGKILVSGL